MNDARIHQAIDWLNKEIKKDSIEIDTKKQKLIEEIKELDLTKMFENKPKKKQTFFEKFKKIVGYGKKG